MTFSLSLSTIHLDKRLGNSADFAKRNLYQLVSIANKEIDELEKRDKHGIK